jgi:hypothetical protein
MEIRVEDYSIKEEIMLSLTVTSSTSCWEVPGNRGNAVFGYMFRKDVMGFMVGRSLIYAGNTIHE